MNNAPCVAALEIEKRPFTSEESGSTGSLLEKGASKEIRNKAGQSIQDVLKEAIEMAEGAYNRSLTNKLKKTAKRLT